MAQSVRKTVLFLGTGNHDRSRIAEVLFNAAARKFGLGWTAASRGLAAMQPTKKDGPMAAAAVKALQARGLRDGDYGRLPTQATEDDLSAASRVVALDRAEHEPLVRERFPAFAERIEYWQIALGPDALSGIDREVSNLIAGLLGGRPSVDDTSIPDPSPGKPAKPTTVRVGRETKGRKGKGVTTISDLPLDDRALHKLATLLKGRCGTGGTVRDGRIEIQGDQRDRLTTELEKLGYRVKRVGG